MTKVRVTLEFNDLDLAVVASYVGHHPTQADIRAWVVDCIQDALDTVPEDSTGEVTDSSK